MKPCCQKRQNLDHQLVRPDFKIRTCRVCGRKHYAVKHREVSADAESLARMQKQRVKEDAK